MREIRRIQGMYNGSIQHWYGYSNMVDMSIIHSGNTVSENKRELFRLESFRYFLFAKISMYAILGQDERAIATLSDMAQMKTKER